MLRDTGNFTGPFNFCMSKEILNEIPRNLTNGKKAGDIYSANSSLLAEFRNNSTQPVAVHFRRVDVRSCHGPYRSKAHDATTMEL